MNQQVNFYKAEFLPRRLLFSFKQIVYGWTGLVTLSLLSSLYIHQRSDQAMATLTVTRLEQSALERSIQELEELLQQRTHDKSLQLRNQRLKTTLERGAELLDMVGTSQQGVSASHSMAEIMEGLAQQSISGISLSEIHVRPGPQMMIEGQASSAEQVPVYLKQLGASPVFSGLRFEDLQLDFSEGPMAFKVASKREGEVRWLAD